MCAAFESQRFISTPVCCPEPVGKVRLCSPVFDPEEEGVGGQESAMEPRSSSERQQTERFLVLSSEEEEEGRAELGDGSRRGPDTTTEGKPGVGGGVKGTLGLRKPSTLQT